MYIQIHASPSIGLSQADQDTLVRFVVKGGKPTKGVLTYKGREYCANYGRATEDHQLHILLGRSPEDDHAVLGTASDGQHRINCSKI